MRTEFVKEKGHCHDSSAGDTRTSCTACPTTYVTCSTEFAIQSQLSRITFLAAVFSWPEKAEKYTVTRFGFIWQIVFNYGLLWFERFVS
jgi:hypothetical protein